MKNIFPFPLLLMTCMLLAKDRPRVTIEVVDSTVGETTVSKYVYPTKGKSRTSCIGGQCETETAPGHAGYVDKSRAPQVDVHVILPDGSKAILRCVGNEKNCVSLGRGSYPAEVTNGNTALIFVKDLAGKERKIKYKHAGSW